VGTPADDQLAPHLQRLPAGLPSVQVHTLPAGARSQVLQAQARWMIAHLPGSSAAPEPQDAPSWAQGGAGERRAYVNGLLVQGWPARPRYCCTAPAARVPASAPASARSQDR
jgi:hypothetical protein